MKEWQKYLNTALLSIMLIVIAADITRTRDQEKSVGQKLDGIIRSTAINSERITSHNVEASVWKDRILSLELGNHRATMDRITKSEALKAIDDLRDYVEANFERKHN